MPIVSFDDFFGGGGYPSDDEVGSFIAEIAPKYNVPPQDALDTWAGEGKGAWQSNYKKRGAREPSYGPFQLLKGGPGTGFPRGLGNAFEEETGLDPSDPKNWKAATEYALQTAGKEGWGQWYGAPARLRGVRYDNQQVAQAEPMRLGPSEGKKVMSFEDFFGGQKKEIPQGEAREVPASEMPEVEAQDATPYEPMPWGEIGTDVANTVTSRTIDLFPTLAGLPGDIISAGEWLEGQLGINGGQNPSPLPGGEELRARLEKAVPHAYTPKTNAGQLAGTAVDFAPMNVGSKANLVRQGAATLGTAAATETAGEIGGPAAAIPTAIIAAHKFSKPSLPKTPAATADDVTEAARTGLTPVTEATKRITRETYDASEAAGLRISGASYDRLQKTLAGDKTLQKLNWNPKEFPKLAEIKTALQTQIKGIWGRKDLSLEEFDELRHKVGRATQSANRKERYMAGRILAKMDDFYDRLGQKDLTAGSPEALKLLPKARQASTVSRKAEEIDRILEVAKNKAGQFSVSGNENAIKTGFRQLADRIARDPRTRRHWTRDEIRAINKIARTTNSRFLLSRVGAALTNPITMGIGGLGSGAGSIATQDPSYAIYNMLAIMAGYGAKGVGGRLAKNQANRARQLVQGGGQMQGGAPLSPAAAGLLALNQDLGQ
jgi:hypothetical protein